MLAKFFTGNPLGSITLASIVTLVGGYLVAHFDPSKLTPAGLTAWTVVSAIVGVLTHHTTTKAGTP